MNRKFLTAFSAKTVIAAAVLMLLAPCVRAADNETSNNDPLPTKAGDFSLRVEPGVALPLTDPQSELFKVGFGESIKAMWALSRYFDLGPSASFLALPTESSSDGLGTAWSFGAGLRLKRPHDAPRDGIFATSPWVDADALYVRTGDLNRFGFDFAAGLSVPIGRSRVFWLGPFVRYFQIVQAVRGGFDNGDAKILSIGLSLEVGSGVEREQTVVASAAEIRTVNKEIYSCPDRDGDGIPDGIDHCPDKAGPMDNWGCPLYKKIVVKKDKIELTERLYFAWDQATLQEESFPVLDEVAQALDDNKGFRVQVEGHASSEGGYDHNQALSEKRAEAVLDYLVAHGISKDRLASQGFGSSVPADTNATVAGRENNRRVEFVVQFVILNEGSK